jgi:hypothetical protein
MTSLLQRPAAATSDPSPSGSGSKKVRPRALPELALVIVLFLVYKAGRVAADGHVGRAFADEREVWRLERWLHLPSEAHVQHGLLSSETLVHVANCYYAWVHFPVSAGFLLWIYIRRPAYYVPLRRLMALVTATGLIVHITFPLAPPRMIAGLGMIDTASVYGPSVYGSPSSDTLSNQYAAMPSLHVGWALIVAVGLIWSTRTRWRWLWALYPAATFAVVVGTANHYWIDGLVAIAMVALIAPLPGILRARQPHTRRIAFPRLALPRFVKPRAAAAVSSGRPASVRPQVARSVLAAFAALPPAQIAAMAAAAPRQRDALSTSPEQMEGSDERDLAQREIAMARVWI